MPIQINPSKFPIWLGESKLRLGTTTDDQTLDHVTNSQERLIQLLFEGVANDQLAQVGASVGLNIEESEKFVERLRPSLLSESAEKSSGQTLDVRFAELVRISFQTNNSPAEVLSKRAATSIHIPLLDRSGLNVVRLLSELGFRKFSTDDHESVGPHDGGELGYPKSLSGVSRLSAARELLDCKRSNVTLSHAIEKAAPFLTIVSATHRALPSAFQKINSAVIAIEFGIDSVFVSGVIEKKLNPCLGCRDLWLIEANQNWASESIQLSARRDHLDDGMSLMIALALAGRNICNFIDYRQSGSSSVIETLTRRVSEVNLQFHPACACQR